MSYKLSSGLDLPDVDASDAQVLLSILRFYGAAVYIPDCQVNLDAAARALQSALANQKVRLAEEEWRRKVHERAAYQLKIDQHLKESRERAAKWYSEVRDEEAPFESVETVQTSQGVQWVRKAK